MGESSIEWTDATWNPVRGCSRVSPGCENCYAERMAFRLEAMGQQRYVGLTRKTERGRIQWTGVARFVPEALGAPLKWRKPKRIFVNSMSDLFHEYVPRDYIAAIYGVMAACDRHRFQVLTKRIERAAAWYSWMTVQSASDDFTGSRALLHACMSALDYERENHPKGDSGPLHTKHGADPEGPWPLVNVDLGVSVEDRKYGVPRIAKLRDIPAARRFLSVEPLLEDLGKLDLRGIDLVIVGAESGHGARPMSDDWVRSIRDQTKEAGAAFFYKQRVENGRKVSLPMLDGRQWSEMLEATRG